MNNISKLKALIVSCVISTIALTPVNAVTDSRSSVSDEDIFPPAEPTVGMTEPAQDNNDGANSPMIIGGGVSQLGAYPWQARLYPAPDSTYTTTKVSCGGTLISPDWILTAKHCIDNALSPYIGVVLGDYNRSVAEGNEQYYNVVKQNNYYDLRITETINSGLVISYYPDIALLHLPTPAVFNNYVMPVPIASRSSDPSAVGQVITLTGWGCVTPLYGGCTWDSIRSLKEVTMALGTIYDEVLVSAAQTSLGGAGMGDSGGPWLAKNAMFRSIQVGVQRGGGCGNVPNGCDDATRISPFYDWIVKTLKDVSNSNLYYGGTIAGSIWKQSGSAANPQLGINANTLQSIANVELYRYPITNSVLSRVAIITSTNIYTFSQLLPGNYVVKFTSLENLSPTLKNALGVGNEGSSWDSDIKSDGFTDPINLTYPFTTSANFHVDAGYIYYPTGLSCGSDGNCPIISNLVWYDLNGDGLKSIDEPGADGVIVSALNSNGQLLITTTTNGGGYFSFNSLQGGNYIYSVTAPAFYTFTQKNAQSYLGAATDYIDSDVDSSSGSVPWSWSPYPVGAGLIESVLPSTCHPDIGGWDLFSFNSTNFTGPLAWGSFSPVVNYNWGNNSPFPNHTNSSGYSIRWSGYVRPKHSEIYTFYTNSSDGSRLWINDQLVVDNWGDHAVQERNGTIRLDAYQFYKVRLEYYRNNGAGVMQISWSSPSQAKEIVPSSQMKSNSCWAITGTYYDNDDFTNLKTHQIDAGINFNWGTSAPINSFSNSDTFSIIWDGYISPRYAEAYQFYLTSSGGARLWVNGQLMIDDWAYHSAREVTSNPISLPMSYGIFTFRLEYRKSTGPGQVQLSWSSPTQSKQIVPGTRFVTGY